MFETFIVALTWVCTAVMYVCAFAFPVLLLALVIKAIYEAIRKIKS